jgi:hypothetical protein
MSEDNKQDIQDDTKLKIADFDISKLLKQGTYTWSGKMCICDEVKEIYPKVDGYEQTTPIFDKYLTNDLLWFHEFKTDIHRTDYHEDDLYLNNYVFVLKNDKEHVYLLETTYEPGEYYGIWHRKVRSIDTRYTKVPMGEIKKLEEYIKAEICDEFCYNTWDYSPYYYYLVEEGEYEEDNLSNKEKYNKFKNMDFEGNPLTVHESCFTKIDEKQDMEKYFEKLEPYQRIQIILGFIHCMMTDSGK